jgi:mitochondrial cardiolipin hydrolase
MIRTGRFRENGMDRTQIEGFLAQSLADRKLSGGEKQALAAWLADRAASDQQKGVIRHVVFELARQAVADPEAAHIVAWLEDVMKAIVPIQLASSGGTPALPANDSAFFSPGEECLQEIVHRFHAAKRSADLCVFTITDDRISRSILEAHRRGVTVRIISDAEKANDLGSDMQQFAASGIAVKLIRAVSQHDPRAAGHMHHKFAIFDGSRLVNGSYNWTRGAANINYENLIESADANLLRRFGAEFERLWNAT